MPDVSVIIPFHNRIDWLAEAVQSVLSQTYTDFELILVDDGSQEPIPHDLSSDKRVRLYRQENRGPASARNRGLDMARGKFIAFLDSDDLFLPSKLERQTSLMEGNREIILSHTSYLRISQDGKELDEVRSGTFSGSVYPNILNSCPIATPTVMIRREYLKTRFDESKRLGEDVLLWIQLAEDHKWFGIDEPLTKVRMHGKNAALDPDAEIFTEKSIIDHIKKSANLPFKLRQEMLSSKYYRLGSLYLHKGYKTLYLTYLIRSLITWPLNLNIYSNVYQGARKAIRNRLSLVLHQAG